MRITASHFGEVCKRRGEFDSLSIHIRYVSLRGTPAMRYGCIKEGTARTAYIEYLKAEHHLDATVRVAMLT